MSSFNEFFNGLKEQTNFDEQSLVSLIQAYQVTEEDKQNKIVDIATKLFKASKLSSNEEIEPAIKQTTEESLEYIKSTNDDVNVSFTLGAIFIAISKLFKRDIADIILNNATTILINLLYKDIKHYETMDLLISTFNSLSKTTTDESKRMYYVSRSNEIGRYKTAAENGTEFKLSPTSLEKLQKALAYKEKGTEAFRKNDFKGAMFNYHCANNCVTGLMGLSEEDEKVSKSLGLVLINNIAVCNMKLNKNNRAIELLDKVLANDPENVKALFRRGKCLIAEKQFVHAEEDLEKALKLSPNDKEIIAEMQNCKAKSANYKKIEAKAYSKMFE